MLIRDIFSDLPSIETDRLILRRLRADDDEAVYAYASDPEVSRHVVWDTHRSIEDSRSFIAINLELYAGGEVATWGIELKEIRTLIGTAGFGYWNIVHNRAEIGYAIARAFWGRGYVTEATRAMFDFGFRRMALNRIEARCEPDNLGSSRVMEKAGMTFEGVLRRQMFVKGEYKDLKMYSILREEWMGILKSEF
jgi:ribosomal-protein-alanine N-acetyltransferase